MVYRSRTPFHQKAFINHSRCKKLSSKYLWYQPVWHPRTMGCQRTRAIFHSAAQQHPLLEITYSNKSKTFIWGRMSLLVRMIDSMTHLLESTCWYPPKKWRTSAQYSCLSRDPLIWLTVPLKPQLTLHPQVPLEGTAVLWVLQSTSAVEESRSFVRKGMRTLTSRIKLSKSKTC